MLTDTVDPIQPAALNPRQILTVQELEYLNQRSNVTGMFRLVVHLTVIGLSGYLWGTAPIWVALPSLMICGAGLALMFCTMHECAHRTAFANPKINDAAAWLAGLLSLYNSTFYRRYHKWHHRYTQISGKDPELDDPKPITLGQYVWQLSGIPWWKSKITGHWNVALGRLDDCYFLPQSAHAEVIRSTRLQLGIYIAVATASIAMGHPWFLVTFWLVPLAVGQPLLRFVLLAEHTGCTHDNNPLTNTRSTLTLWPLRFLMWNMPYHTEHHLYPSIPFHALPEAHERLGSYFSHVESGYVSVHNAIITSFKEA
ncbi:MAG: fatty acid desaturase family protein [Cyanobacteria bacterium J06633_2]